MPRYGPALEAYRHLVDLGKTRSASTCTCEVVTDMLEVEDAEELAEIPDGGPGFQLKRDFSLERRVLPPISLGRGQPRLVASKF